MGIRHLEQWWIGLAGCALLAAGCRAPAPVDVRTLPLSHYACRILDRSFLEIEVQIVQPGSYSVHGSIMNEAGLARLFSKAAKEWGKDMAPVALQAKPETPFGDVWRVVESAATNGCPPAFDVRVPEIPWRKSLRFDTAEPVPAPTSTVRIVCRRNGLRFENRPVTPEELRRALQLLPDVHWAYVSITATDDIAYQTVIDVLDECEHVGLRNRILRLDPK